MPGYGISVYFSLHGGLSIIYLRQTDLSPAIPLTLAWVSGNCMCDFNASLTLGATETKRSLGLSITISLGNTLSIALPWMFPTLDEPDFFLGVAICTGLLVLGCILAFSIHWYCRWENNRADRLYGITNDKARVEDDEDIRFRYFR